MSVHDRLVLVLWFCRVERHWVVMTMWDCVRNSPNHTQRGVKVWMVGFQAVKLSHQFHPQDHRNSAIIPRLVFAPQDLAQVVWHWPCAHHIQKEIHPSWEWDLGQCACGLQAPVQGGVKKQGGLGLVGIL